ncbi:MAG: thioredoxin, partial [Cyanobacteria bacterium J069]
MSSSVVVISDPEFEPTVLAADQPVLVYFWAPWCGPCRLMSPLMESVAAQYGDRLKIVKMEVDANPESVARYKVEGVPALILFRAGQPVEAIEGVVNKQRIEGFLDAHLPPDCPQP